MQRFEQVGQLLPQATAVKEVGHQIQALIDLFQPQQGLVDPCAQQPLAHRRVRLVERFQQSAFAAAIPQGFGQLQVTAGFRVQGHEVGKVVRAEGFKIWQPGFLSFP